MRGKFEITAFWTYFQETYKVKGIGMERDIIVFLLKYNFVFLCFFVYVYLNLKNGNISAKYKSLSSIILNRAF